MTVKHRPGSTGATAVFECYYVPLPALSSMHFGYWAKESVFADFIMGPSEKRIESLMSVSYDLMLLLLNDVAMSVSADNEHVVRL